MDGSSRADAESALAQSTRLRHALAMRLSAERAQLAALEQESRGLHDTLALMERSAGRRLYLRFRAVAVRILLAIRHPVWTAVSLLRAIAATPAPAAARAAIRHLLHRAFPLRLVAPVAERTDQPEDFSAIRWIGPVSVRHEAMDALFCHPASSRRLSRERTIGIPLRRRLSQSPRMPGGTTLDRSTFASMSRYLRAAGPPQSNGGSIRRAASPIGAGTMSRSSSLLTSSRRSTFW